MNHKGFLPPACEEYKYIIHVLVLLNHQLIRKKKKSLMFLASTAKMRHLLLQVYITNTHWINKCIISYLPHTGIDTHIAHLFPPTHMHTNTLAHTHTFTTHLPTCPPYPHTYSSPTCGLVMSSENPIFMTKSVSRDLMP